MQVGAGQLGQVQGPCRRDGEGEGVSVDGGVPVERKGHSEAERHTQGGEQGAEQAVAQHQLEAPHATAGPGVAGTGMKVLGGVVEIGKYMVTDTCMAILVLYHLLGHGGDITEDAENEHRQVSLEGGGRDGQAECEA